MLFIIVSVLSMSLSVYLYWCARQVNMQAKYNGNMFQTPVIYENVTSQTTWKNRKEAIKEWWVKPRASIRGMFFCLLGKMLYDIIVVTVKEI